MNTAIAVFTFKGKDHILDDGGTSAWVLHPRRAAEFRYAVCTRSHREGFEGPEPKGSAFLVGKISGIVNAPNDPGRFLIRFSEYAEVAIPEVWQGWRNPVRYTTLEDLGIAVDDLEFQPMPECEDADESEFSEAVVAAHGEKMIEVKLRFWTNSIAEGDGEVLPKHAWSGGVVRMETNRSHDIVPQAPIPFHSMLDVGRAIEKCLIDHEIQLHPSRRMQKYTAASE